ncbi:hypothetical protein [Haloarchaeobius sp. HRN-SO-5]|uniref:hypothetical protein n=1 Tax=Haloarchaeobius sp. HRN-SO-5 TaxID=3446118 RepID=UPI003EBCDA53
MTDWELADLDARIGAAIPLLLPAWFATYPLRWLLARQTVRTGAVPDLVWILPTVALAFFAAGEERDDLATVGFGLTVAVVFYVAQVRFGPPVPVVRGRPEYLLGPALNAVGAVVVGYLVAYRGLATPLLQRGRAALHHRDDAAADHDS